jgi:hypothetical protein
MTLRRRLCLGLKIATVDGHLALLRRLHCTSTDRGTRMAKVLLDPVGPPYGRTNNNHSVRYSTLLPFSRWFINTRWATCWAWRA